MLPDPWPTDATESTRLLARLVRTIEERTRRGEDDLLAHFLWTAWPTVYAQAQ
jgi:hypothetical protein